MDTEESRLITWKFEEMGRVPAAGAVNASSAYDSEWRFAKSPSMSQDSPSLLNSPHS